MHKTCLHTIRRRSVRFLKWSRKKYAAFCSLHCQVTIGQVRKGIADASLSKSKQAVSAVCSVVGEQSVTSEAEDDRWSVPDIPNGLEGLNEWTAGRESFSFSSCACSVSAYLDCFFIIGLSCQGQAEKGIWTLYVSILAGVETEKSTNAFFFFI